MTDCDAMDVMGARPFLKWAGGKLQLLDEIRQRYPHGLGKGTITRYVEPFVGGGAVFFDVFLRYAIQECFLRDVNKDLVLAYNTIRGNSEALIETLYAMQADYYEASPEEQLQIFYAARDAYNEAVDGFNYDEAGPSSILRAAQLIFLNRTCFNGLYRVNSKGTFNVPFGRYVHPRICDSENLTAVARVMRNVDIQVGDFEECAACVDSHTFVYFDPPYRPLNKTSKFTSYASGAFDEASQLRLARFFRELDQRGAKLMLSNSDPKNENPDDDFFEQAYAGFKIERVKATRMISRDGRGRGRINEVIVTNY